MNLEADSSPLPTFGANPAERRVPALHVLTIRGLCNVLAELGHDVGAVLAATQVHPSYLEDPPRMLGLERAVALIEHMVRVTGKPNLGLYAGNHLDLSSFGWSGLLIASSPDLRTALQTLAWQARIYNRCVQHRYFEDEAGGHVELHPALPLGAAHQIVIEGSMAMFWRAIVGVRSGHVGELVCDFPYPAPPWHSEYSRCFADRQRFSRPLAAIHIPRNQLELPCIGADQTINESARRMCEQIYRAQAHAPVVHRLRAVLRSGCLEQTTLESCAAQLAMSARTLNRQLAQAGTSYQALLDEYRRELALWYLHNTEMAIGAIALELGFSDGTNFSRTLRRWFGKSATELRAAAPAPTRSKTRNA